MEFLFPSAEYCLAFSFLQMLATTKPFRVLFLCSVSCIVMRFFTLRVFYGAISNSRFSFSLVFPYCLIVWFLTFCLLPGSSLCLALWILFADRRQRPFTWVPICLALNIPVCHLFNPACVLTIVTQCRPENTHREFQPSNRNELWPKSPPFHAKVERVNRPHH